MANADVKVREIRLLESYSQAYNRFIIDFVIFLPKKMIKHES